ncbi:5388_t:CDS:2 [Funneliformis mosseae]|uniref:5388_t:CDS:1 n=1 Tax=Funneliformis mosseae TaxID=27381 RepID=A0A9N8Z3T1_FUNMO|nr:5388_t:CDS:2 [Funneliformis mosseae]
MSDELKRKNCQHSDDEAEALSYDPMILSQEERKSDILEKSFKKSCIKEKSSRQIEKTFDKVQNIDRKLSPDDFEKELLNHSKKAISHKLEYIDKKIKEFVENV